MFVRDDDRIFNLNQVIGIRVVNDEIRFSYPDNVTYDVCFKNRAYAEMALGAIWAAIGRGKAELDLRDL